MVTSDTHVLDVDDERNIQNDSGEEELQSPSQPQSPPPSQTQSPPPSQPFPWLQMTALLLTMIADPVWSSTMYPFLNQLIAGLSITHGDEKKVGYYSGLMDTLFYTAQAITAYHWNKLSNYKGRKPIILSSLLFVILSCLLFGFSRSYWTGFVLSRCIAGLFNANVGITKTVAGDLNKSMNLDLNKVSAFLFLDYPIGTIIASLFGGYLQNPHESYPKTFSNPFWAKYPYLLPLACSAGFVFCVFWIDLFFLKETLIKEKKSSRTDAVTSEEAITSEEAVTSEEDASSEEHKDNFGFKSVISSREYILPVAIYGGIALVDTAFCALLPIFYGASINKGGLGLSPSHISLVQISLSIGNGLLTFFWVPICMRKFGGQILLCISIVCQSVVYMMLPVMESVVQRNGLGPVTIALISVQIFLYGIWNMSYATIFMIITDTAPTQHARGVINGFGQIASAIGWAIGPLATALYAASIEYNLLHGYLVYYVLEAATAGLFFLTICLPTKKSIKHSLWKPIKKCVVIMKSKNTSFLLCRRPSVRDKVEYAAGQ